MRSIVKFILICALVIIFVLFPDCKKNDIESEPLPQIFKTLNGECYHLEDCVSLRRSKIPITIEDAQRYGLRPCYICKPSICYIPLDFK